MNKINEIKVRSAEPIGIQDGEYFYEERYVNVRTAEKILKQDPQNYIAFASNWKYSNACIHYSGSSYEVDLLVFGARPPKRYFGALEEAIKYVLSYEYMGMKYYDPLLIYW